MEKGKVLREERFGIKMPTKLIVGDPSYFEDFPDRDDLVYNKAFRGRGSWLGEATIREILHEFGEFKIKTVDIVLCFAPNKKYLDVYSSGKHYQHQKVSELTIGVDTAKYIIETNLGYEEISTGSDGYFGEVLEFYDKRKLEGILVSLSVGEYVGFSNSKDIINYLFNEK